MDALAVSEANVLDAIPEQIVVADHDLTNDNKFQKAIAAWRTIDFSSLIPQLDSTASDIVAHQKDALLERKEVAQKTKEFRKLDDAGKLAEYKTVLKAYQTFIDLLTTHGKESSSAFLQLYTSLSDAPDPFPLLEASVEALVVSEDTLPKLTTENADLQKRINRLTAQLEQTEAKLNIESKLRQDAESGTSSKIRDIEASWSRVMEEKESNWSAKEKTLEEKVENQERLLRELKASYEVSQRLDQHDQNTAIEKAASAELALVSSDLEKTSTRLAEMEARNEQLRVDLARATSQATSSNEDDTIIVRLQTENSGLLRKIESAKFDNATQLRDLDSKFRQAERQRSALADELSQIRSKLHSFSDYDEIKRELNMLRSIELSEDGDVESDMVPANGSAVEEKKESLEQLLLARNKKLSNDSTLLRVSNQELNQQLESLREELSQTNEQLEKSQKLSSTLENDLLQIQEEAANVLPSSGMSVAGTYTSRYPQSSRRGRASPTSSIISGYDTSHRLTTLESLRSGESIGGGSGILPMIQAQRDRFKQKNQQLEEELQKTYTNVTALRQEVASLQKDNLNLYEKTRYVSAYSRGGASSSSYGQNPSHTSVSVSDDGQSDRWKSQYEANMSPFAAFRGRETSRAYKRMTLPERMIFSLTRIILNTRTSRNFFAAYCMALHILVFLMLYWMGSTEATAHHAAGVAVAGNLKDTKPAHVPDWQPDDFGG